MRTAAAGSSAVRCRRSTFTQYTKWTTISELLHPGTCSLFSLTKIDRTCVRKNDSDRTSIRELIEIETGHKNVD